MKVFYFTQGEDKNSISEPQMKVTLVSLDEWVDSYEYTVSRDLFERLEATYSVQ